jgi:hypothetical protein
MIFAKFYLKFISCASGQNVFHIAFLPSPPQNIFCYKLLPQTLGKTQIAVAIQEAVL